MKKVSKEEFYRFIDGYDGVLSVGHTTICEPPIRHYRDKSIPSKCEIGSAKYFFDKEVARICMDWLGPNGKIDKENTGEFWEYSIKQ